MQIFFSEGNRLVQAALHLFPSQTPCSLAEFVKPKHDTWPFYCKLFAATGRFGQRKLQVDWKFGSCSDSYAQRSICFGHFLLCNGFTNSQNIGFCYESFKVFNAQSTVEKGRMAWIDVLIHGCFPSGVHIRLLHDVP